MNFLKPIYSFFKQDEQTKLDLVLLVVAVFLGILIVLSIPFLVWVNDITVNKCFELLNNLIGGFQTFFLIYLCIISILITIRLYYIKTSLGESYRSLTFLLFLIAVLFLQISFILQIWVDGNGFFFTSYFENYEFPRIEGTYIDFIQKLGDPEGLKLNIAISLILGGLFFLVLFCIAFFSHLFNISSKTFYQYIEEEETLEKIFNLKKNLPTLFLATLALFLIIQIINAIFNQKIQFPPLFYAFSGVFALCFTLYFPIVVYLDQEKLFKKIDKDWLVLFEEAEEDDDTREKRLFGLVRHQIEVADSFFFSFCIIFSFLGLFWIATSIYSFNQDLGLSVANLSFIFSLMVLVPYNYCIHVIKKRSFDYIVKFSLFQTSSTVKDVLSFRNIILTIIIPFSGILAFLISNLA